MKLNLGCGKDIRIGMINVDWIELDGVDVVTDLNSFPYPFDDCSSEYILMSQSLEHIFDTKRVMDECYRILSKGGILEIYVPFYRHRGAFDNPTHIRYFTERSFGWFVGGSDVWYGGLFSKMLVNERLNVASFPSWHTIKYLGKRYNSRIINRFFTDTIHCVLMK